MLRSGRVRLALGVAVLALFSFPAIAHACGPEAYMTPEQIASGAYDMSPPPWDSGEAHSHDAPAAGAGTAPGASPDAAPPAADPPAADAPPAPAGDRLAGQGPAVTTQAVQDRSAQRGPALRSGSRPAPAAAPAATQPHHHPAAAPTAARTSPPVAGLVKHPASAGPSTRPATRPARRAERAHAAAPRRARPAAEAGRQVPVRRPLVREAQARAAAPSPADGTLIATIGIGLVAAAAGLATAVLWRRRGGDPAVLLQATDPAPPTPPGHDDLEAELQEIIAEEQANRADAPAVRG